MTFGLFSRALHASQRPLLWSPRFCIYFGWVRTGAIFSYFGLDQRLLAYTIQDYLLRSAGIAFRPFAFVLLSGAACIVLWRLLRRLSAVRDRISEFVSRWRSWR